MLVCGFLRECRLARRRRLAVPGTDVLTNVAAEQPVTNSVPQFRGDGAAMFNREIRNATASIQHVRSNKGVGRTGVEAARAGPTVRRSLRIVVLQLAIDQQRREEEPASRPPVQQQSILPEPAQTGEPCEVSFEQRRGIDYSSRIATRLPLLQKIPQQRKLLSQDVVIIPRARRVRRNLGRDFFDCIIRSRRTSRAVIGQSQHDHAAGTIEHRLWSRISVPTSRQVMHLAGVAVIEPVDE